LFLILLTGAILNLVQLSRTVAPMRQYARDWDARDQLVRTTDALPRRLSVPWDEYEQNLGDFRRYYRTRDLKNE
jgi:YD repeat-containing protein